MTPYGKKGLIRTMVSFFVAMVRRLVAALKITGEAMVEGAIIFLFMFVSVFFFLIWRRRAYAKYRELIWRERDEKKPQ
ncbi:MAG: hypothetical protein PHE24_01010 [Patescibacteria group bacterium]|nr:hypothetical protein [Patescibacteria group bacterium]